MSLLVNGVYWITVAYTVLALLFATIICIPVSAAWTYVPPDIKYQGWVDLGPGGGGVQPRCLDEAALAYSTPVINALTDLVVWLLPLKLVWDLQLPRRQKVGLLVVLGMGFL